MTESPSTTACEIKPTWNAAVCKGDVGRLAVGGPDGSGGAPAVSPALVSPAAGPAGTVLAQQPVPAHPGPGPGAVLAERQVVAVPAHRLAGPADLPSRQSFSAAMARSSP